MNNMNNINNLEEMLLTLEMPENIQKRKHSGLHTRKAFIKERTKWNKLRSCWNQYNADELREASEEYPWYKFRNHILNKGVNDCADLKEMAYITHKVLEDEDKKYANQAVSDYENNQEWYNDYYNDINIIYESLGMKYDSSLYRAWFFRNVPNDAGQEYFDQNCFLDKDGYWTYSTESKNSVVTKKAA